MPIVYTKEVGWEVKDPTPEEITVLVEIGKGMIVEGLAGAYTNEKYKKFLTFSPDWKYFKG